MPADVFQHDNGVIDDKTGRHGQGHQRQIVKTEVEQVHEGQGAEQRDRNGDRRDQGGAA